MLTNLIWLKTMTTISVVEMIAENNSSGEMRSILDQSGVTERPWRLLASLRMTNGWAQTLDQTAGSMPITEPMLST